MGKGKRVTEIVSGISVAPSVSCHMQIPQYVSSVEKKSEQYRRRFLPFFFSVLLPLIF